MERLRLNGQVLLRDDEVLFIFPDRSSSTPWELRQAGNWAVVMDGNRRFFVELDTFEVFKGYTDEEEDDFVWLDIDRYKIVDGKHCILVKGCYYECCDDSQPHYKWFEIPSGKEVSLER